MHYDINIKGPDVKPADDEDGVSIHCDVSGFMDESAKMFIMSTVIEGLGYKTDEEFAHLLTMMIMHRGIIAHSKKATIDMNELKRQMQADGWRP